MRPTRLAAAVAATALIALPLGFATPVAAATLPEGDALWAITCDNDPAVTPGIYSVDPADAAAALVGTGTGIADDCAQEAAYDPTTGKSYYIHYSQDGALATIDTVTGVGTIVDEWNGDILGYPEAIAIGLDGKAYVIDNNDTALYEVDLGSAETTFVGSSGVTDIFSFSVDPTTGLFYVIDQNGTAFEMDVTSGAVTPIGDLISPSEDSNIFSLQIDTSGAWWVESDNPGDPYLADIWTGPLPDGDTEFTTVGPLFVAENETFPYSNALLITYPIVTPAPPAPALAATGSDATGALGVGIAAVLLLGAGTVLVLRRGARA